MLKKTAKLIITCLLVILANLCWLTETQAANLSDINFYQTEYWYPKQFREFLGDKLSSSHNVTTKTTELNIVRRVTNDYSFEIVLVDSRDQAITRGMIQRGRDRVTLSVPRNSLQANKEYAIGVNERNAWGTVTGIYKITYFTVDSGAETHQPPKITAFDRTIEKNIPNFNIMEGVSAIDDTGNDLTSNIKVSGQVNTGKEGIYPISFSVTDKNGLSTVKNINITVKGSVVALLPPSLDVVTSTDLVVTGRGMSGALIYVTLGSEVYRETIATDGEFEIKLEKPFPVGTGITAYIADDQGKQSEKIYAVVQSGSLAIGVNRIVSSDVEVTGKTTPNAKVEVEVKNDVGTGGRAHIFEGVSDENGKFTVSLNGHTYEAGTPITVLSKSNGQTSTPVSVIVYPKKVTINTVASGDTVITGQGDKDAMIHLSIAGATYDVQANSAGNYTIKILPLQKEDKIVAYQTSNNIVSDKIELIVSSRK